MGGPSTLLSYSCSQVSFDDYFDDNDADDGCDDNYDLGSFGLSNLNLCLSLLLTLTSHETSFSFRDRTTGRPGKGNIGNDCNLKKVSVLEIQNELRFFVFEVL